MNQKAKDYIRRNTLDLESDNRMDSTGYVQYAISEAKAYAAIAIAEEGMRQKAIEAFKFFEVEPNKWVGVIPETVCQFSEITDKNGNSIFEHDLILIHESESSYQFTVEVLFHKGMFCYKNKACGFTPLWYVSDRCEVIGNAFDNPELMKEGVQP